MTFQWEYTTVRCNYQPYDEVPGLVGAGEESGRMSVHLVFEPGGSAVVCLPAESVPELVCRDTLRNTGGKGVKNKRILLQRDPSI